MGERDRIRWLHRRAGLGLAPGATEHHSEAGPSAALDALLRAPRTDPDPWASVELDPRNGGRRNAIVAWIRHLLDAQDTFAARRTWVLHGWLVSSLQKVTVPQLMVEQARLFDRLGGGRYPDLLEAVTIDAAMLVYLDGGGSTGAAPNENYGRELMELFTLGVGEYDEHDVQAAAAALTGWTVRRLLGTVEFVPARHDPTPQTLVGVPGVDDVESVVEALVAHPAHAPFVARRVVAEYLGDPAMLADAVEEVAEVYRSSGMRLDDAIEAALRIGLDGRGTRLVLDPMTWLAISVRATGVEVDRLLRSAGRIVPRMGQLPMLPPNVGGWPSGPAWFTTSGLLARSQVAAALVDLVDREAPIAVAAERGDLDELGALLCLAEPFGASTAGALAATTDPTERLTLALVSPEHLTS